MTTSDRMDFWYNPDTRQYEEGTSEGPAQPKPEPKQEKFKMAEYDGTNVVPKMMNDLGTRFHHLADLQDYLTDGLIAVTNSLARYANDADQKRKEGLEGAIKLLNVYQNTLAQYDRQKFEFNQTLDECAPSKAVLDAIKSDRAAAATAAKIKEASPKEGPQEPPSGQS